jgi:GT2 family glycosyltransferase
MVMLHAQEPHVDVVVRCKNRMPFVQATLERLRAQRGCIPRIAFFDLGSVDGSRRAAERAGVRVIEAGQLVKSPGAMMNHAMRATTSPIVVFVDADATPLADTAVLTLLKAFAGGPTLAAAFGRQVPAKAARATPFARNDAATSTATQLAASFSMSASAIHRSAWNRQVFDERLRYAEDVEWTTRVRQDGWTTVYVADAPFEQSQESTLRGHFSRTTTGAFLKDFRTGLSASRAVPITIGISGTAANTLRVRM